MHWTEYLAPYDRRLLSVAEGRRAIAAQSSLLFSLIYMRHHLRDEETGDITISPTHEKWSDLACRLKRPTGLREFRNALAAPRSMGKSTWWFLFIPAWAGAYGYREFIAAFADAKDQAVGHLATFKSELDNNELLRHDFPDFTTPARRANGVLEADRVDLYIAKSRFAFAARGADSKLLGLKIGHKRPDMLILDDVEGDESTYSVEKSVKRLRTIQDAILPLNERAAVTLTGTVTMADSIVHQTVKAATSTTPAPWITEENFACHHHRPIEVKDDGTEVSIWPEKWPIEYLQRIRNTRSYAKNFDNQPMAADGNYWTPELLRYGRLDVTNIRLLSIDPHVKRGKATDYTGMSVVRYSTPYDMFDVAWSLQTKARGKDLQALAQRIVAQYDITAILIETNQGGDLWTDDDHVFDPKAFACKIAVVHQKESKEIRASRAVAEFENDRVLMARGMEDLTTQMLAFPNVRHDDLVDSVSSAIIEIRKRVGVARKINHDPAVQARWLEGA